jgi:hypothetical protein
MKNEFKPVFSYNKKNLKAKYYYDGSGYIEVCKRGGEQIFCEESGTIKDHLADLWDARDNHLKETRALEEAIGLLETFISHNQDLMKKMYKK